MKITRSVGNKSDHDTQLDEREIRREVGSLVARWKTA